VVVVLLREEDDLEHMHFLWYRNADRDDIPPDYQVVVVLLREEDDLEHIYLLWYRNADRDDIYEYVLYDDDALQDYHR
jgi:hypothetical protein